MRGFSVSILFLIASIAHSEHFSSLSFSHFEPVGFSDGNVSNNLTVTYGARSHTGFFFGGEFGFNIEELLFDGSSQRRFEHEFQINLFTGVGFKISQKLVFDPTIGLHGALFEQTRCREGDSFREIPCDESEKAKAGYFLGFGLYYKPRYNSRLGLQYRQYYLQDDIDFESVALTYEQKRWFW